MKLKTWLKAGRGRTVALAKHLNVTKSMVSQMADETSTTPIPPTMYRRIRAFTGGQVDFEDMIPGDPFAGDVVAIDPASDRRAGDRRQDTRREEDRADVSAELIAQAAALPDQRQLGRFTGGRRKPGGAAGRRAADVQAAGEGA